MLTWKRQVSIVLIRVIVTCPEKMLTSVDLKKTKPISCKKAKNSTMKSLKSSSSSKKSKAPKKQCKTVSVPKKAKNRRLRLYFEGKIILVAAIV